MKRMILVTAAVLGAGASLLPATASAQSSDQWEYGAMIYGWLPKIGGQTTFPTGRTGDINVGVDTILDHLKFTFMGTLEARKGPWGAFTDVVYMDVGGSKSQTRDLGIGGNPLPVGITANLDLDLKAVIWTIAGEYRVATDRASSIDLFAGARLVDARQTLAWNFSADLAPANDPGRSGSKEVNVSKWDAIVGAKGRVYVGDGREWFVPWYLDVGTGQTDLTWQAIGGIGYAFKWGEVVAAWRYMDYKFKSGTPIDKLNFSGPAIGVAFRWQ
jgi:hypothetical protein